MRILKGLDGVTTRTASDGGEVFQLIKPCGCIVLERQLGEIPVLVEASQDDHIPDGEPRLVVSVDVDEIEAHVEVQVRSWLSLEFSREDASEASFQTYAEAGLPVTRPDHRGQHYTRYRDGLIRVPFEVSGEIFEVTMGPSEALAGKPLASIEASSFPSELEKQVRSWMRQNEPYQQFADEIVCDTFEGAQRTCIERVAGQLSRRTARLLRSLELEEGVRAALAIERSLKLLNPDPLGSLPLGSLLSTLGSAAAAGTLKLTILPLDRQRFDPSRN